MRFLIDNALSVKLADRLRAAGHDAVHVRDLGMQGSSDEAIFATAAKDARVLISADTDFASILARTNAKGPSFILFRGGGSRRWELELRVLSEHLPGLETVLEAGCIVVIDEDRLRIRMLPLNP